MLLVVARFKIHEVGAPTDLPVLTREGVYTGITRARRALTLVARDLALLDRALQRPTLRVSGLGRRLEGAG